MNNNPPLSSTLVLGLLGLGLAAHTISGQVMLSPVAVIGTDLGTFSASSPLTNMINHSGVTVPFVSGTTDFNTYFAAPSTTFANANYANNWQSGFQFNLPLTGYVDFDLGAAYTLNQIAIWNITVGDVAVRIADDPGGLATGQLAGNFTLTDHHSSSFSYPVDVRPFTANFHGRYVRLEISSAYKLSPSDSWAYAIIGEVVLSAAPTSVSPMVNIARDPNGDVRITFTGTLQSSTNVAGIFEDVPGNPSSTLTIPKQTLSTRQYFRARGN